MIISSIRVGGFANIEHAVVYDTMSSAFVAPNNYGKSNMLAAIEFGTRFMCASENDKKLMMQDTSKIRNKRREALKDLEDALGVKI